MATVAVYLGLDEWRLVEVLALFLVFIDPQLGKHLRYLRRHEAAEDGVARILGGCGQDAGIHVFVYLEEVADFLSQHAPLVVAEVVDDHEKHLLAAVEHGEDATAHDVVAHQRTVAVAGLHPVQIVLAYILGKTYIGFLLLHLQHLGHLAVGATQLQLPVGELAVDVLPVFERLAVHNLHHQVLVVLLVAALGHLGLYLAPMYVLFEGEEYLVGVDGLDEIVGYL